MHELAITESILEITLRHADQAKATRVTDIHLVLGELASVVDDSVQFYWDMISADTLAQLRCPDCEGGRVKVIAGEEFRLEAIEVDSDTPADGDVI
jgi:hydrogenase nickel incorporation protein HypA/HybF